MTIENALAPKGAPSAHRELGQGSLLPGKWQLLKAIEDGREALGLKRTSLAVLRAMMSFIRHDRLSTTQDDMHICFASNAALAERTHVSIQTIERHIAQLVDLGIIVRRASGNGKRWARRDRQGRVILATGLSLSPLLTRYGEFKRIANEVADRKARLRLLRDKCALALAELKPAAHSVPRLHALVCRAQTMLRRKLHERGLQELLSEIQNEIKELTESLTEKTRGTDTRNEGHKDSEQIPNTSDAHHLAQDTIQNISSAFPRLCSELNSAGTQRQCEQKLDDIAGELRIGLIWRDVKQLGIAAQFVLLGTVLERLETVRSPERYLSRLLRDVETKRLQLTDLINRPSPAPTARFRSMGTGRIVPKQCW